MLFPNWYLIKNCRRCGKNVRIDKREYTSNEQAVNEELYCPYCGAYIGRVVVDKEKNFMDIAI